MSEQRANASYAEILLSRLDLRKLFLLITSLYLIVDSVNGVMLRAGLFSVSMPFKLALLFFAVLAFRIYLQALFWVSFVLLFVLLHLASGMDLRQVLAGVDWLTKFILIPVLATCIIKYLQTESDLRYLKLVVNVSFFVLSVNVFLGIVGIGYAAYSSASSNIGAKGFIYAGNELGLALLVSGGIILSFLILDKKYKTFIAFGLFFIVISALTAVKVAALSALLMFVLFPAFAFFNNTKNFRVDKKTFGFSFLIMVLGPLVVFSAVYFLLFSVGLWERIEFFLQRVDMVTLIFSGRNLRAELAMSIFTSEYSYFEMLFGKGILWLQHPLVVDQVEIDLFDFLMRYGLFGMLLPYCYLLWVLAQSLNRTSQQPKTIYFCFVACLVLAVSLVAGHVLYAATAAPLIAILFAMAVARHPYNENAVSI
jgi:hypothetical protein